MRVELKGVKKATKRLADGSKRVYWYAWVGGPRLDGQPGSPEFAASYWKAHDERDRTRGAGTLLSVTDAYQRSIEFEDLAPRTRADYLKQLKKIEAEFGTMPIKAIPAARGVFKSWRDELARSSRRQADYAWAVLARVCSWAVDRDLVDANPCERGGRVYSVDRRDKIWTDDDEAQFLAAAPPHVGLALTLALWTGQRQGDLLKLTWKQCEGGWVRLRQRKTGARVAIPMGAPLKAALAATPKRSTHVLVNIDGVP